MVGADLLDSSGEGAEAQTPRGAGNSTPEKEKRGSGDRVPDVIGSRPSPSQTRCSPSSWASQAPSTSCPHPRTPKASPLSSLRSRPWVLDPQAPASSLLTYLTPAVPGCGT